MTAAFEWSPGGCCCGETPGWWDAYTYWPTPGAVEFQRQAVGMLPIGTSGVYGSKTNINWSIPGPYTLTTHRGVTSDGLRVWSFDEDGSLDGHFACYDAVPKTRRFSVPGNIVTSNLPTNHTIPTHAACNATEWVCNKDAGFGQVQYRHLDFNGGLTDWPPLNVRRDLADGFAETIILLAGLEWPKAAMLRTQVTAGRQNLLEFIIGDVAQATEAPIGLTLINRQTIRSVVPNTAQTVGTWHGFDYFGGHYGAAISYALQPDILQPPITHSEVLVDGANVLHDSPSVMADNTIGVHVLYPHETLGAGYVGFTNLKHPTLNQQRMVICKGGAIIWERAVDCEQFYGSTDRWLYFRVTSSAPIGYMSDNKFTRQGENIQTAQYWIARHDGFEVMPAGVLTNTYRRINGGIATSMGAINNAVTRQSDAVPGTLPGSYEEMWNARNG